jgi:hypothetical protein
LLPRILLCLGVAAGTLSIWDTLSHTWDPSYQAPALALGPTHTNYHAFREFMLSVGAVLVELYGVFQPAAKRTRPLWVAMCRANTIGPTPDAYNGINKGGGHVYSSVGSTAVRKIQAYKRRSMGTYQ